MSDPFLIKKLLKSEVCRTINSARMHYLMLTYSTTAVEAGKAKKTKRWGPGGGVRGT